MKIIIKSVWIMTIMTLIAACRLSAAAGVISDSLTIKSEAVFYSSEDSLCTVSIKYPVIQGMNNKSVQEKINSFLKIEFLDSPEWLNIDDCDKEIGFTYECSFNVRYNSQKFICIQQFIYEYTGGAHGNYALYSFNISASTGEVISLTNIFDEQKLSELSEITRLQILEDFKAETLVDVGMFEDSIYILPEQDFFIVPGYLVLQFDPYEIASYAMGEIEVQIAFDKIKEYLKPNLPFDVE
ncbi:MAG: DUF3298 and DUF4163 domain-containing protein [Ignavibacteriales bacterium]|nr:MAG: DUF3298 and DUF4163 domain-containing protein [Ignavibacteriales bacterium]